MRSANIARRILRQSIVAIARSKSNNGRVPTKCVKKLNGAALTFPFSLSVVTQAIGRGVISETNSA